MKTCIKEPGISSSSTREGILLHNARCVSCNYELSGLQRSGVCPECGISVELSLDGCFLQGIGLGRLDTLRSSLRLVQVGLLAYAVSNIITVGLSCLGAPEELGYWSALHLVGAALAAGALATALVGYWRFTVTDFCIITGVSRIARKCALSTACIQCVAQVASVVLQIAVNYGFNASIETALRLVNIIIVISWTTHYVAIMTCLHWLGKKIPDAVVVARTTIYMWVLPLLTTIGILAIGLGPIAAALLCWSVISRVMRSCEMVAADLRCAMCPEAH